MVFLGGRFTLKGLRERFQETLKLDADHAFSPSGASTPWPSALRFTPMKCPGDHPLK